MKNYFYNEQLEIRNRLVDICYDKGINCEAMSLEIEIISSTEIRKIINSIPAEFAGWQIAPVLETYLPRVDSNTFIYKIEYDVDQRELLIHTVSLLGDNCRGTSFNILEENDYMPKRYKTAPNYISRGTLLELLTKIR